MKKWRFPFLNDNTLNKNFQQKRNREILKLAKQLDFPLPAIRKALIDLNEIKMKRLRGHPATLSNALTGMRSTSKARTEIAQVLHLDENEIFFTEDRP